MAQIIHPEDALFNAGASDGYYEIVGASYTASDAGAGVTPTAVTPTAATAKIDLSTPDQTGCMLTHNYATGETTLKWDKEPLDPAMYGTADDIQTAVEDITRGQLDPQALFEAFRAQMMDAAAGTALSAT